MHIHTGQDNIYEQENQDLMRHYGLIEVEVVRDRDGNVLQAAGRYPDGEWDILHLHSPNSTGPETVHASSSKLSDATPTVGAS
jgi:hypothetical protein